ncbi:hypothetical protein Patl1_21344 [Pistacia atlantica]|uniref:Uncharacterized protein n=1 Tax=Pistacia atlantica TaxID=434234 RepID=A0ACC1BLF4_9ROSI|nr:hypothetical protein Patl1_21344 [Pistacia atlantica]
MPQNFSSMDALQYGDGPSNRNPKRPRRDSQNHTHFRHEISQNRGNGESLDLIGASGNGPLSLAMTEPAVFHCPVCFQPSIPPVYQQVFVYISSIEADNCLYACMAMVIQCENDHLCCSSCYAKLQNTCPFCYWPIGYNRNWAIDRLLGSVKLICQNAKYGCKETMTYWKKDEHEKECHYSPCSCPFSDCNFVGSYKQFQRHFGGEHKDSVVQFLYCTFMTIALNVSSRIIVLQEKKCGDLFILKNTSTENNLNQISVSHFAPSWKGFSYHTILARRNNNSLAILQSLTKSIHAQQINDNRLIESDPLMEFIYIPSHVFGWNGLLRVDICISQPTHRSDEETELILA